MRTRAEALAYPRGDIVLGFCAACGFIGNLAFDADLAEYSRRYEGTQGFSPTFREFHRRLALDLVDRHGIRDKEVLEIGCGQGEFLALLCEVGGNRGLGFDPSYDGHRTVLDGIAGAHVIADFYSDKYADRKADLVCCKMTLEHISGAADFVRLARRAMRPDGGSVIYFLVPDAGRIFRDCAFEDIYYEHCSYFTPGSLARLFRAQGFEVLRLGTEYQGQYLAIEAELADAPTKARLAEEADLDQVRALVESFRRRCEQKIADWCGVLRDAAILGRVVLWGSGSKAAAFLNAVDVDGLIEAVVDINPHKQGCFMPGSGLPIVGPQALPEIAAGTVIIMNPVYRNEISDKFKNLGVAPRILSL